MSIRKFGAACLMMCVMSVTAFGGLALGAGKTYQVTGPVLEVSDAVIVVQKGKERWEIQRDPAMKVDGELKVGAKVTIEYTMVAATVAAKPDKAKK